MVRHSAQHVIVHETKLCNMHDMQLENQFKRAGDFNIVPETEMFFQVMVDQVQQLLQESLGGKAGRVSDGICPFLGYGRML